MSRADHRSPQMKQRTIRALYRWLSVIIALLAFILVPFFLFESTTENTAFQYLHANQETGIVATVAAALLALDVFLPIPSSIISTTVGSVLGMAAGTVPRSSPTTSVPCLRLSSATRPSNSWNG